MYLLLAVLCCAFLEPASLSVSTFCVLEEGLRNLRVRRCQSLYLATIRVSDDQMLIFKASLVIKEQAVGRVLLLLLKMEHVNLAI